MQEIEWNGDDCYCCGSGALTLHTDADQGLLDEPGVPSDWTFICYDGDPVACDECGFRHQDPVLKAQRLQAGLKG